MAYVRAYGLVRAGAMRSLAAYVAAHDPAVLAISQIDSGDALALATRFAREWAYRGGQALFWTSAFRASQVRASYLPMNGARPFNRRGFLRVDGRLIERPCSLYVTFLGRARKQRVPEMRFVRAALRANPAAAVAFVHGLAAPGLRDLGFADTSPGDTRHERIYARGFTSAGDEKAEAGPALLGMPARATLITA